MLPTVWQKFLNSCASSEQTTISAKHVHINWSSVEYFVLVTIKMTNIKRELNVDSFGVLIFWNNSSCVYRNDFISNKIFIHIPVNVIFPFWWVSLIFNAMIFPSDRLLKNQRGYCFGCVNRIILPIIFLKCAKLLFNLTFSSNNWLGFDTSRFNT